MTTVNLNSLTNFEINKLTIESYCAGQNITFEPQRAICDIMELMDDTCYFTAPSGSKQNFSFALSENVCSFISKYKLNINHTDSSVTVSSAVYPDIEHITLTNSSYRKAVCFIVIMIANRYSKKYTA